MRHNVPRGLEGCAVQGSLSIQWIEEMELVQLQKGDSASRNRHARSFYYPDGFTWSKPLVSGIRELHMVS